MEFDAGGFAILLSEGSQCGALDIFDEAALWWNVT